MRDIQTDMGLVMQSEHGRRLIKHLLDISGCDGLSFEGSYGKDCYTQGQRALGLRIKNLAYEADFERFIHMLRESHSDGRSTDD